MTPMCMLSHAKSPILGDSYTSTWLKNTAWRPRINDEYAFVQNPNWIFWHLYASMDIWLRYLLHCNPTNYTVICTGALSFNTVLNPTFVILLIYIPRRLLTSMAIIGTRIQSNMIQHCLRRHSNTMCSRMKSSVIISKGWDIQ